MSGPRVAFVRFLEAMDELEIPYMVGGSAASAVHGIWRATGDVDFVVRLRPERIEELVRRLEREYYIDAGQIRSAIEHDRSFNVIHLASGYKFDLFPLTGDLFQQTEFRRRRSERGAPLGGDPVELFVATPEDVILSKLRWYRLGGGVSEHQWNDVLGVIAVQGHRLDMAYLRQWADYLKVSDLLEQAITERHKPIE